ncbi:MAG: hypothetical protein Q9185_006480 [Variospora sp. 1 TL-2023]
MQVNDDDEISVKQKLQKSEDLTINVSTSKTQAIPYGDGATTSIVPACAPSATDTNRSFTSRSGKKPKKPREPKKLQGLKKLRSISEATLAADMIYSETGKQPEKHKRPEGHEEHEEPTSLWNMRSLEAREAREAKKYKR